MSTAPKTAAVLLIGDEILSGRTQDTNLRTIAQMLGQKGIAVVEARTVPDVVDVIVQYLNTLRAQVYYVFTTGGIGPTHDDRTADAVARAFGVALEQNADAMARLAKQYGGAEHITPARAKMAMVPAGARLIDNAVSGAPGFAIGNVHVMAGVPRIMQAMMEHVLPRLEGGAVIHSRSVAAAIGESTLAEALVAAEAAHGVSVGSYPKFAPGMGPAVTIVVRGVDLDAVDCAIDAVAAAMRARGAEPEFC